jgi:hypothetical protein
MKNRPFAVDEEHKLQVSENKATRKVFLSFMYDETCGISVITERGARNVVCASRHIAFGANAPTIPQT